MKAKGGIMDDLIDLVVEALNQSAFKLNYELVKSVRREGKNGIIFETYEGSEFRTKLRVEGPQLRFSLETGRELFVPRYVVLGRP